MEKVLDRGSAAGPECKLTKNSLGLYDLRITDETGAITTDVQNITFLRAVGLIEESMYTGAKLHGGE